MTVGAPRSATGARCGSAPARTSVPFRRGSVFPKLLGCLALLTAAAWAQSPDGPIIDTFAGVRVVVGAGPATEAVLNEPISVAVDGAGNLYIADFRNYIVRKVDASTRRITTIAGTGESGLRGDGGPATKAQLRGPDDVAVDGAGNVYIAVGAVGGFLARSPCRPRGGASPRWRGGTGNSDFGGDGRPPDDFGRTTSGRTGVSR